MIRMVHQRVEEHARLRPEAPAVAAPTASDESLTYGELNRRANRLARHLISLGVGPEVPVGVLARGGAHQVIASLAVLKAGGCYLPLDPAYPDDRSAFALGDAGARVLLSEAALLAEREALPSQYFFTVTPGLVGGVAWRMTPRLAALARVRVSYLFYNVDEDRSLGCAEAMLGVEYALGE